MYPQIVAWFLKIAKEEEFTGKRVIDVGSADVNGSLRLQIEKWKPKEYIGIDIDTKGRGVDLVLPAERIVEHFGVNSFDTVVSTEMLEHVVDWRKVITNMKKCLKPGGYMYVTTLRKGYKKFHLHPVDCWRYEIEDFERIFEDFEIIEVTGIRRTGVAIKARKPEDYTPTDLSEIALYSMKEKKRIKEIVCQSVEEIKEEQMKKVRTKAEKQADKIRRNKEQKQKNRNKGLFRQ